MNLNDATKLGADDWRERAAGLRPEGRHFIDGDFVASADGGTFDKVNPATAETIAEGLHTPLVRRRPEPGAHL